MLIRRETPADVGRIDDVHRQAFAVPAGAFPTKPGWGDHFQARPLAAWDDGPRGVFRYAAPFEAL